VANLEMDVRKLGVAGKPDATQHLTGLHNVTAPNGDAAALHMTVLGLPAATVADDNAVAAIAPLNHIGAEVAHAHIHHAVPAFAHAPGRGGEDGNPPAHSRQVDQADVDALVAVAGKVAAGEIARAGTRLAIHIILNEAVTADGAIDRQREGGRRAFLVCEDCSRHCQSEGHE
jgi:hypothetical protein